MFLAAILSANAFAVEIGDFTAPPPIRPEVRAFNADGGLLLSKEGRILAAAFLRPATPQSVDADVLSAAGAAAILPTEKLANEVVRERRFPMISGAPGAMLNVIQQTRQVQKGARMLITCSASKPKDAAPMSDAPLTPPPLEMAVQIYAGADGSALKLTYIDLEPVTEKNANATELRARALTFEDAKKQRVVLERSGPASWTIRRRQNEILLTARLARDTHDPALLGSFVFFLGSQHDEDAPEVSAVRLDKTTVPARDAIEGRLRVYASGANPYLSQDVTVVAEVALPPRPDGTVPTRNLPCFFYESTDPAKEEGEFRFRFAPPVEGLYGVHVYVTTPASKCETKIEVFRAGVPASPGMARIKPGERVLRLDDGTLFAPVGCDMARFGTHEGADEFRTAFTDLARLGANAASIGISRIMPLEGPEAGRIDPKIANDLDAIFRAAQARNIHLILALENGAEIGKGNATHPYFVEMGGPLTASPEFFHNPAAKRYYQARMAYVAARYGAFRALLSWELMRGIDDAWPDLKNNPEDKTLSPALVDRCRRARRDVEEWAELMAQQMRGFDQHGHPICVSTSFDPGKTWTALQAVENMDWTLHRDLAGTGARSVRESFPGIETKIGQWADAARGTKRVTRPWAVGGFSAKFESGNAGGAGSVLCASLANGLACAPMPGADPRAALSDSDRSGLRAAAIFSAALAEISTFDAREELPPITLSAGPPGGNAPLIVARACRRGVAAWVQSNIATTAGLEFKLPGLTEGDYTISWMDTRTGEFFESQKHTAPVQQAGKGLEPLVLKLPQFKGDAVLFIVRDVQKR